MPPTIRTFEARDRDALVALSLRAWAPVFASLEKVLGPSGIYARLHPDWRADQRDAVTAVCASADDQVWVAETGTTVAGFVAVRLHHEAGIGEITMLAVDPDHQRTGVGTLLTSFALERIKAGGMTVAMVETGGDSGHAPARHTYERTGFVELPVSRYFKEL